MDSPRLRTLLTLAALAAACTPSDPDASASATTTSGTATEAATGAATAATQASGTTDAATDSDTDGATTETTGPLGPDDLLRVTDITMRGTHNSYHVEPQDPVDDSHRYTHAPLDVQLGEQGVRAFELDVHSGEGFPVFHIPLGLDQESNCADLGACLGLIDGWSAENPKHHLIVVWIEIKDELDSGVMIKDYDALDAVIRAALAPERLYEPDEFKRGRATLREALDAEGWPTLGETRGKVMVVLLDTDLPHHRDYTYNYTSIDGRAMFARASAEEYDLPWAVVAKIDDPTDAARIAAARAKGMLIASNTGGAGDSDEDNALRLAGGIANGSHMLCDDFPAPVDGQAYFLDLPGGTPSICNPQTAPVECTPAAIESLGG